MDSLMPSQACLFREARELFGLDDRIDKAVEECGELIVALQHMKQGRGDKARVVDELADVQVTVCQLAQAFGEGDVAAVRRNKIARLERLVGERRISEVQS